jgi:hypothetical protein
VMAGDFLPDLSAWVEENSRAKTAERELAEMTARYERTENARLALIEILDRIKPDWRTS